MWKNFCNTTPRGENRGATLAARFDPGAEVHQGDDVDLAADSLLGRKAA
jgi:hypothetical protein